MTARKADSGPGQATLEILFADDGAFHTQEVTLPVEILDQYPRLIDCLQEDPEVLRTLHVDLQRLCSVRRTS
ncbi:MAG: hypothetical protein WEA09_03020 [Gemmatimonadota bacterium]